MSDLERSIKRYTELRGEYDTFSEDWEDGEVTRVENLSMRDIAAMFARSRAQEVPHGS